MRLIVLTTTLLVFAAPAFADPPGRVVTYTGQNGGGAVVETTRERDRQTGVGTLDRDVTFNDGSTRSVDATAVRTAPGEADVTRTVTRRNGETAIQTGSVSSARTDDGRVVTGIWEAPSGTVATTTEVTRGDGVRTRDTQAVFEDGSTRSSSGVFTRTGPGEGTVENSVTRRNGETRNRRGTVTVNRRP